MQKLSTKLALALLATLGELTFYFCFSYLAKVNKQVGKNEPCLIYRRKSFLPGPNLAIADLELFAAISNSEENESVSKYLKVVVYIYMYCPVNV